MELFLRLLDLQLLTHWYLKHKPLEFSTLMTTLFPRKGPCQLEAFVFA